MRLDKVTIGEFKNLRNLQVDFDEKSPEAVGDARLVAPERDGDLAIGRAASRAQKP